MRLKNRRTGEVKEVIVGGYPVSGKTNMWECSEVDANEETGYKSLGTYTSLAELNSEWEDVPEEPKDKGYWYIDDLCRMRYSSELLDEIDDRSNNWMIRKLCGNYFSSREEAELAVRKLKAWKRLKDKGFRFEGHSMLNYAPNDTYDYSPSIGFSIPELDKDEPYEYPEEIEKDLDICFGGEE